MPITDQTALGTTAWILVQELIKQLQLKGVLTDDDIRATAQSAIDTCQAIIDETSNEAEKKMLDEVKQLLRPIYWGLPDDPW